MRVTKLNVENSSDRKNRKNALPRTIGLASLALGVVLSSIGLWTHFHGKNGPSIATYKDESVYVTASYGEDANIPKDAEMRAYPVTPETDPDEYSRKVKSAMTAVGRDDETDVANAIYDIGFYVGDEEIEPAAPVAVTIQDLNDGFTAGENIAVVHLGEDDAELLADASVDENGAVSFTSDKFSEFVLLSGEIALFSTDKEDPRRVAYFPLDGDLENKESDDNVEAEWNGLEGTFASGVSGKAIDFPGNKDNRKVGGYIEVTGLGDINFSGATISYWSKISDTDNQNWGYVWGDKAAYTGVIQGYARAGQIYAEIYNGDNKNNPAVAPSGYDDLEVWHMITVVYSDYDDTEGRQTMTLYVDGESKGTADLDVNELYLRNGNKGSGKNLKDLSFRVGFSEKWTEYTCDVIDELMIYNYAQSEKEVEAAYTNFVTYSYPRRVAYFPLDEDQDGVLENNEDTEVSAKWEGSHDNYVSGINGNAADFRRGYIDVTGLDKIDFSRGATISYWSKFWKTAAINWGYVWGDGSDYTGVIQGGDYGGKIHAEGYNREESHAITAEGYDVPEFWHQITVVYSAYDDTVGSQTMTLYVDGEPIGTVNLNVDSLYLSNTVEAEGRNLKDLPFRLGYNEFHQQYTEDAIDELMIYNYALSGDDIRALLLDGRSSIVWFDGTLGYGENKNYYPGVKDLLASADDFEVNDKGVECVRLPDQEKIGTSNKYKYTLAGWYDIYAKKHYEPGALVPVTDLGDGSSHDTVFYADWWAEDYDFGNQSSYEDDIFAGANKFVTTRVFDYNEMYNTRKTRVTKTSLSTGGHKEYWNKINETKDSDVVFLNWFNNNNPGYLSFLKEEGKGTDGGESLYNGGITSGLWGSADGLFSPVDSLGVNYLGEGRSLYQYNAGTGYYYYDSKLNAASYNQHDGRFYVYSDTEKVMTDKDTSASDFLPFNVGSPDYKEKDGTINYWFGFSSSFAFHLPDDVGTPENKTNRVTVKNEGTEDKTNDMIFTFSGDDDVWVFVDGELVLDMGGIHDVVFGSINFSTGQVVLGDNTTKAEVVDPKYYQNNPGTPPEVANGKPASSDVQKFIGGLEKGEHELVIYYMERGSSQSNCAIYFNLCPSAGIEIEKTDNENHEVLEGAGFTLRNEEGKYYFRNNSNGGVDSNDSDNSDSSVDSTDSSDSDSSDDSSDSNSSDDSNDSDNSDSSNDSNDSDSSNETTGAVKWVEWDGIVDDDAPIHYTNEEGVLRFDSLSAEETYILSEVVAPGGYKVNGQSIRIEVKSMDRPDTFEFEVTDFKTGVKIEDCTDDQVRLSIPFSNERDYLPLDIVKYGGTDESNYPLNGTKFNLYVEDEENKGNNNGRLLGTLTSSEGGLLSFEPSKDATGLDYQIGSKGELKLRTDRIYYLEETDAPAGYELLPGIRFKVTKDGIKFVKVTEEGIEFVDTPPDGVDLSEEGTTIILELIDPEITVKVAFLKEDELGKPLAGATFELYGNDYYVGENQVNADAEYLWTGTSTWEDGKFAWNSEDAFPELRVAEHTYYLVETKAPDGYNLLDSVIRIDVDENEVRVSFVNDDEVDSTLRLRQVGTDEEGMKWLENGDGIIYAYVFAIPNSTGYELPETGGSGTLAYLLTGFMLMLGSTIILVAKRRLRCTR